MLIEDYPAALDIMLASWNERDANKIRGHLDQALAPDVHFVDPTANIHGIDAFEKMVHDVQAMLSGAVYTRVSAIDTHNDLYRYHWAIHMNGELAVQGFDVSRVANGKVAVVMGFFGDLPITGKL